MNAAPLKGGAELGDRLIAHGTALPLKISDGNDSDLRKLGELPLRNSEEATSGTTLPWRDHLRASIFIDSPLCKRPAILFRGVPKQSFALLAKVIPGPDICWKYADEKPPAIEH